jgi:hypothetical protein
MWDLIWTLTSPGIALYLRDSNIIFNPDPSVLTYYWALSAGFATLALFAFRRQDGMTRIFSARGIDIAEECCLRN